MIALEAAERVAIITGTFVALAAAIPAVIAAVVSARTRKENREQHAEGQAKVDHLATVVQEQTGAIKAVGDDVAHVKGVVVEHLKWHAGAAAPTEDTP